MYLYPAVFFLSFDTLDQCIWIIISILILIKINNNYNGIFAIYILCSVTLEMLTSG